MRPIILVAFVAVSVLALDPTPARAATFPWSDSVVIERVDVRELAFGRSGGCLKGHFCMNTSGTIDASRLPSVVRELHLGTVAPWNPSGLQLSHAMMCAVGACFAAVSPAPVQSVALVKSVSHMPEPTTALLVLSGLAGLASTRRRHRASR